MKWLESELARRRESFSPSLREYELDILLQNHPARFTGLLPMTQQESKPLGMGGSLPSARAVSGSS